LIFVLNLFLKKYNFPNKFAFIFRIIFSRFYPTGPTTKVVIVIPAKVSLDYYGGVTGVSS
jgi:hypothetical protein